jgi:redox-sensitive bicupin YhaK (pirin superfamily)
MTQRRIRQLVPAHEVSEGAGVTVLRSLGTPRLRHLDPFLMLDHFASDDPDDYIAGFPDHPHRGFVTLTYLLDGYMRHRDSLGHEGVIGPGGAQWMKAASGVIHAEMPEQAEGLLRGFQLWVNLPAREKMADPEYQEFPAACFPVVEHEGARVRILAGGYGGAEGPIRDPHTDIQYLDVALAPGARFRHRLDAAYSAFLYPFEGALDVGGTVVAAHRLAVLDAGEEVDAQASGAAAARFILVAGHPLGEPIVQYGPFVMNTEAEIRQAFEDYRAGRLVRGKGRV